MLEITMDNFEKEVLDCDKPVLVDFWATWCGPCMMLAPTIEEIANERPDIKVCKVNVDEAGDLASAFGIMSIPTVMIFKNGEVYKSIVGLVPKEKILMLLD